MYSLWTGERYMILDRNKYSESGYIAEELMEGVNKAWQRCCSIKSTTDRGVFPMETALEAYQVSKEDYERYLKGELQMRTPE